MADILSLACVLHQIPIAGIAYASAGTVPCRRELFAFRVGNKIIGMAHNYGRIHYMMEGVAMKKHW